MDCVVETIVLKRGQGLCFSAKYGYPIGLSQVKQLCFECVM